MQGKLKILLSAFLLQSLFFGAFQAQNACGFIENKGQILDQSGSCANDVAFLLPLGNGLNVQLRHSGFSYDTYGPADDEGKAFQFHRVDVEWLGGNPHPRISTGAPAPDLMHFFGTRQAVEVRHFQRITYHDIYPGIDVEFWSKPGSEKPVEYNFVLEPGASVEQIQLRYTGALTCFLDGGGAMATISVRRPSRKYTRIMDCAKPTTRKRSVQIDRKHRRGGRFSFELTACFRARGWSLTLSRRLFGGHTSAAAIATAAGPWRSTPQLIPLWRVQRDP